MLRDPVLGRRQMVMAPLHVLADFATRSLAGVDGLCCLSVVFIVCAALYHFHPAIIYSVLDPDAPLRTRVHHFQYQYP